jgi:hypothetical protein
MLRFTAYTFTVILTAIVLLALIGLPAVSIASPDLTQTPSATPSDWVHLPIIRNDATPTPPPTPTNTPYSAAAAVDVTIGKPINASTFNPSSFRVHNDSLNGERLIEVRIDLSTAIFFDMVFDPEGQAGDKVAKDVTIDRNVGVSFDLEEDRLYEVPHDGGFDVLVLTFDDFDRGDQFEFSVDVDPTSIRGVGAPGPMETGSVGGLELVGATITARFDDGTTLVNQLYRPADPGGGGNDHSGAAAVLRPGLPERPAVEVLGVAAPAVVHDQNQTVRVSGPAGRPVTVLVVEGGLFTEGVDGGGFDLDPFEANSAVTTREYTGIIGPAGYADVPIVLTRSGLPGGLAGGINIIAVVFDNHYGVKGLVAGPLALELE